MTGANAEPSSRNGLETLAGEILAIALEAHARFDRDVWQASDEARVPVDGGFAAPSYHNEHHIGSVTGCTAAVFRAAEAGRDPFRLREHLGLWNGRQPAVSWDEAAWAFHLAFACHDLGNIASSSRLVPGPHGRPTVELRAAYDSSVLYPVPQVEIRSAELAGALLGALLPDRPLRERIEPLVRHLVLMTVFHFEKTESDELFWLPMQTVDMIGSYFFSPLPRCRALAGLFAEMRVQKPGSVPVVGFLTSLKERFDKLLPDPGDRTEVVRIFESNRYGWTAPLVFGLPERFAPFRQLVPHDEAIRILLTPA